MEPCTERLASSIPSFSGRQWQSSGSSFPDEGKLNLVEFSTMQNATTSGSSRGAAPPRDDSMYVAHNLILQFSVSMALKAVLELGIPDIIANAEGGKPLSVAEILAQLPTKSAPGPILYNNLKRVLRPLVRAGFFGESFNSEREIVYGLTDVSKWFIQENESNLTSIADLQLNQTSFGCWENLHEVILDETANPFVKAHGVDFFQYGNKKNTEYGALIQDGMVSYFNSHKDNMMDDLRECGLLDGVSTLVDVGGGWGATIAEIVAEYPHMQGINFDLAHVIATAPPIKGVKHVSGNFLESVPSGDAMLLKLIIHDCGDEESIEVLKSCYRALPKNGKVIIAEYILSKGDNSAPAVYTEYVDLILLAFVDGARERYREEYERLLIAAGFLRFTVMENPRSYAFIVAFKD